MNMQKVVINILNPGEAPEHNGQMVHALFLAKELHEGGATVEVIFQGKGVSWLPRFTARNDDSHPFVKHYGEVFDAIRPLVRACNMCCKRFDATEAVQGAEIPILGEGKGHANVGSYLLDGYQVLNY
jgi:hypothetical protein